MNASKALKKIQELLIGSGVVVNGPNPWDIQIKEHFIVKFYYRVIQYGSLGLGEAYMDGWWDCKAVDELFNKILRADLDKKSQPWRMAPVYLKSLFFNRQTRLGSLKVAKEHYDLPKELYDTFLDEYNQYTCAKDDPTTETFDLERAQVRKLHLICRKLHLNPGDHVLDIGCGWGGFARFAAMYYGCKVTGLTISKEQAKHAREFTKGLDVEIKLMDYRDLGKEKYDKISIIGMIEHVGWKNYRTIMEKVFASLKDDGLFLLHTIGSLESVVNTDAWIDKYIFPNSMLPSIVQLAKASEGLFTTEDFHNFGPDYDKTLMAWNENFQSNWPAIAAEYNDRFKRMWEYYLLSCAGSFRARRNQLYQFVYSKNPTGNYIPVR